MKRAVTILTIALVGLSACTRTSLSPEKPEKGRQVQFTVSPIKTTQTRAADITAFDQSQTFGSTAYAIDTTVNTSANWQNNSADATLTVIENKEIKCQNGVWRAWNATSGEAESYWWEDFAGKKLTFLSWYPMTFSNSLVNSDNLSIASQSSTLGSSTVHYKDFSYTGWKVSNTAGFGYTKDTDGNKIDDGSVDLLLAKSADCTEKNSSSGVLTQFYHQLCNVKFYATIADEPQSGEKWYVTKVEISDIYTKADLVSAATQAEYRGIWRNHSDSYTYTYTPSSSIELVHTTPLTEKEIFPQTLMIPQSVASTSTSTRKPTVTITYIDENNETKTISGALATNSQTVTSWDAGKSITYTISISTKEEPIEFSGSVSDWGSGSSTNINIGTDK